MPQLILGHFKIYYEEHGKGEPLILVCGYGADYTVWQHVVPELAKQFRVIIFNNRGTGTTVTDELADDFEIMAQDILALMHQLGLEQTHLLGHSMGGKIAQAFAHLFPKQLKKLILVNTKATPSGFPLYYIENISTELAQQGVSRELCLRNSFAWIYGKDFLQDTQRLEPELARVLKQTLLFSPAARKSFKTAALVNQVPMLNNIDNPTLIITSDEDILILAKESELLAKHLNNAKLAIMTGCGHMPQIEKPEELCRLVINFLQ